MGGRRVEHLLITASEQPNAPQRQSRECPLRKGSDSEEGGGATDSHMTRRREACTESELSHFLCV